VIRHCNGRFFCIVQKTHVIFNSYFACREPANLGLLLNGIFDEHIDGAWKVVLQMLQVQAIRNNLHMAVMINNGPFKNSMMKSLGSRMTNILSVIRTELVVLPVQVADPRMINSICNSANRRSWELTQSDNESTEEGVLIRRCEVGSTVGETEDELLLPSDPADLP